MRRRKPKAERSPAPSAEPAKRAWFQWPLPRWVLPLVGIVVTTCVGLLRTQEHADALRLTREGVTVQARVLEIETTSSSTSETIVYSEREPPRAIGERPARRLPGGAWAVDRHQASNTSDSATVRFRYRFGGRDYRESWSMPRGEASTFRLDTDFPLVVLPSDPTVVQTPAQIALSRDESPTSIWLFALGIGAFVTAFVALVAWVLRPRT